MHIAAWSGLRPKLGHGLKIFIHLLHLSILALGQIVSRVNEPAAKAKDAEIKRYQDQVTIKQQEMSMYQQMDTIAKQQLSPIPDVAYAQNQMRQWMIEKVQLGFRQAVANQAGQSPQAAQFGQQMETLQLKINAKQQEIRLLEMKAKAGQ